MFTSSVCPNCQIDREKPDLQKVAERNQLKEKLARDVWWHNTFNVGVLFLFLAIFGVAITIPEYSFRKSSAAVIAKVNGEPVAHSTRHWVFYDYPYEFEVKGRTYRGYARNQAQIVKTLEVYFDSDKPWKNRVSPSGLEFGLACIVFGLMGFLVICVPWRRLFFVRPRRSPMGG